VGGVVVEREWSWAVTGKVEEQLTLVRINYPRIRYIHDKIFRQVVWSCILHVAIQLT
jgi:hypothetical protein